MHEGFLLGILRELHKRISQGDVSRLTGISQAQISRIEAEARSLSDAQRAELHPLLAIGERQKGERRPRFVVARVRGTGALDIPIDRKGRIGTVDSYELAKACANYARWAIGGGQQGDRPIYPVPVWADEALTRRDVYVVPRDDIEALLDHTRVVIRGLALGADVVSIKPGMSMTGALVQRARGNTRRAH